MSNFAIMRTAKLKTAGNIAASISHTFRERPTPNADPRRTRYNRHIGASSGPELREKIGAKIPVKRRKDAVLCIEHFFGASPEWWKQASPEQQDGFFQAAHGWLAQTYGRSNVVYFGTQYDELTPHAVAYVVPLRDGKLNAKAWLGGKERLSALQTSFSEAVEDLGLRRGIEGSQAKHERVKRFYGHLVAFDRERRDELLQANRSLTMADRAKVLAGKLPPAVEEMMVEANDLALNASWESIAIGPRRERAGYQRGAKDLIAQQRQLDEQREKLAAFSESLTQQVANANREAASAKQRAVLAFDAASKGERARFEREKKQLEEQKAEFEKATDRFKQDVIKDFCEQVGLHIAIPRQAYIGQIVRASTAAAVQLTKEYGLVLHQIGGWIDTAKQAVKNALGSEKQIFIYGQTVREATAADIQLRDRMREMREQSRDFDMGR